MDWRTTYPTLETLGEASFETLDTWVKSLPPPQTDVQKTVWRRLGPARHAAMVKELHRHDTKFAAQYEDVIDRFRRLVQRV